MRDKIELSCLLFDEFPLLFLAGQWGNTTELEELIENGSSGSLDFAVRSFLYSD